MKQTLFYAILICLFAINCGNAQVDYGTRTLPAYPQVVPNFKLFPTGYPDTMAAKEKTDFSYFKNSKDGSYKFVGTVITTDDIKKKIGTFMIATEPAWKDDNLVHEVKKLFIYADSLVLKENLWLPEADIEIQTRVLYTQGFNINSSGLSWKSAANYNLVNEQDKYYGAKGGKAGNITLSVEKVLGAGKLIANGGDGASVFAPAVKIKYPTGTVRSLTVRSNQGCADKTEGSDGVKFTFDYDVIAAVCETINDKWHGMGTYDCFSYPKYDNEKGDVAFNTQNGQDSYIYDPKAAERLTFDRHKPGEPGNKGVVTINAPYENPIQANNNWGKAGLFLGRVKDEYAEYGKERDTLTEVPKIKYKEYALVYARAKFDARNSSTVLGQPLPRESRSLTIMKVPSDDAMKGYKSFIDSVKTKTNDNTNTEGRYNIMPYYPHPDFLSNRIEYLSSQYFVYYRKTDAQKERLNAETDTLTEVLYRISNDKRVPEKLKSPYALLYTKAAQMSSYRTRNIDEFGNVAGYRPMFSLKTTMEYMDANLKTDLRLFVMSDILANDETQAKKFIDRVPTLITDLKERNRQLSLQLEAANLAFDVIQKKALPCADSTDALKEKLINLEKKFLAQAEIDAEVVKWKKIGLKIAAVGIQCVPVGQPALGQIGGGLLNTIADNVEEPLGTIAQKAVANMDVSEVLKDMAKKKIAAEHGRKPKLDYNRVYQRLELSDDRILTAMEKVAGEKEEEYKNRITELNKTYTKRFETAKGFAVSAMASAASASDLQKRVAQMKAISYEFADISRDITIQNNLKQEIFSKLNDALQQTSGLQMELLQNANQIALLQSQVGKVAYSEDLEAAVKGMRAAALNRLQWIEYQMIKSYEYTTMGPYTQRMPCAAILQAYYDRTSDKKTMDDVDEIVDQLATAYKAQRQDMGSKIMAKLDLTKYKADIDFNRKIILAANTNNSAIKTEHLLSDLNTKETLVLDLQNDFINEIIKPDEEQTRIKDIELKSDGIEFAEALPDYASFKIKLEILDGGIMRQDTNFYLFRTGSPDGVADTWTWTVKNNKGKLEVLPTRNSEEIKNLVGFLATGKSDDNEKISRYTSPPAWSRCRISITEANGGTVPKISYLELRLKCDNYEIPSSDDQFVLDVKTDNAPTGGLLFSSTIRNKKESHIANYYATLDKGTTVSLSIDASVGKQFEKWQVYKRNIVEDKLTKDITLSLDRHTRVVAVFKQETEMPSADVAAVEVTPKSVKPKQKEETHKAKATKKIKIYAEPYTDSDVLKEVDDSSEFTPIKDADEDGFQRVVFDETQEGYVIKQ